MAFDVAAEPLEQARPDMYLLMNISFKTVNISAWKLRLQIALEDKASTQA